MKFVKPTICLLALAAAAHAQTKAAAPSKVDFGMMTWVEVKQAMAQGKTTALIMNGGTEQRGPQNVNAGHTLMGKAIVLAIAERLGNAIAAPVLPFSPNNANPELPGTIGLTTQLFADINEQVAEQMIKNGFKNVVLMGDHGGGQQQLAEVAKKLNAKYSPQGIHVVFCSDVYEKGAADFNKYLEEHHLPVSSHAGIPDTSMMLYLGGDQGWVRKELIAGALGDPVPERGAKRDPNAKRVNNGISGDGRKSSVELGKRAFDMRVDYGVKQIQQLLGDAGAQN